MKTHELYIYDEIGPDFYGLISGKSFIAATKELKAKSGDTLSIRINSPGGDVFEAKAIGEAIARWDGPTIAEIDALAASAATTIAIKADTVRMAESAMFMIHNAWSFAMGDSAEMHRVGDTLATVTGTMLDDYERKSNLERDDIAVMMDLETWMTAKDALEYGFIDEVSGAQQVAARIRPGMFRNMPDELPTVERHEHQTSLRSAELERYKITLRRGRSGV